VIGIALLSAGRMARVHAKAIGAAGGSLIAVYDVVEPAPSPWPRFGTVTKAERPEPSKRQIWYSPGRSDV
jgi:hypothetical protein